MFAINCEVEWQRGVVVAGGAGGSISQTWKMKQSSSSSSIVKCAGNNFTLQHKESHKRK